MSQNPISATEKDLNQEVKRLTRIYQNQMSQLERAYSKNDPVSWRRHPLSPLTPMFLSLLMTNFPNLSRRKSSQPKIIDLGCGAAEKTDKLRSFSLHVTGVDNLDKPLKQARRMAQKRISGTIMRILKADILDLPFKNETFDGAHDYLAFLHITKEDWMKYIKSVHRVLKKGAPLLIVTFSGNDEDFYGYPINKMKNRGIVFSDRNYSGDKEKVTHLINSYFYFPKEEELRKEFGRHFEILEMIEIPHPLRQESADHKDRMLWHLLLKKRYN